MLPYVHGFGDHRHHPQHLSICLSIPQHAPSHSTYNPTGACYRLMELTAEKIMLSRGRHS